MSGGLVAVLLVLWAGVLLPGAWRDHRRSPVATVDGFTDAMRRLAGDGASEQRRVVVPGQAGRVVAYPPVDARLRRREERLRARRRSLLLRLAAVTGFTLLTALVVGGGVAWTMALLSLAALGGYVALLRNLALRARQAREVVRTHPAAQGPDRPARGASSGPAGGVDEAERAVGDVW